MYSSGAQMTPDPVRALKLFQEACGGGDMNGCARLAPGLRAGARTPSAT